MNDSDTPKPNRRWFRFSLRTLMIAVVLLGGLLGWFALKMRQAQEQRWAVEAIQRAGGAVWYDYQWDGSGRLLTKQEPPGPSWLRGLFGEDFFSDVVGVAFHYPTKAGDALMEHVAGLAKLKRLELYGTQVTDAGLENLKGLTKLRYLVLYDTLVTDEGIEELRKALPNCEIDY